MEQINKAFESTPEAYDSHFNGALGVHDMERHYKMSKHFSTGIYVDVGCFDSILPIMLAENPLNTVYAIDHAPGLISFLKERFKKVNYLVADAYKLPFKDGSVDYVSAGEIIEHLEHPDAFIKEAMRILKINGWLSISTPFEERGTSVGGKYHMWRWNIDDIRNLLSTEDIEIINEGNNKTIIAWKQKLEQ